MSVANTRISSARSRQCLASNMDPNLPHEDLCATRSPPAQLPPQPPKRMPPGPHASWLASGGLSISLAQLLQREMAARSSTPPHRFGSVMRECEWTGVGGAGRFAAQTAHLILALPFLAL